MTPAATLAGRSRRSKLAFGRPASRLDRLGWRATSFYPGTAATRTLPRRRLYPTPVGIAPSRMARIDNPRLSATTQRVQDEGKGTRSEVDTTRMETVAKALSRDLFLLAPGSQAARAPA